MHQRIIYRIFLHLAVDLRYVSVKHHHTDTTVFIELSMKPVLYSCCFPVAEFVVQLDASDDFLMDRVMNLPERLVQELNYEQKHFLQRLVKHRQNRREEKTVLNYFDELEISPVYLGNP